MKTKLTVTIDEDLLPKAKQYARAQGHSLSQLIETALRDMSARNTPSFASKWRGRLKPAFRQDDRYRQLAKKYL
ncbi:MAG: hypothetical protein GKS05_03155 [Nitrospirales bacterium]|nr:hypothetical protein [Nitrospirales bacterium]